MWGLIILFVSLYDSMIASILRMTRVHGKETLCCRLLHPDVAVGCSLLNVGYCHVTPHARCACFFCYPECDPSCYFLRSSYKVPVRFPRTLFPRPPHRECITHCSSVPLKKKKINIKNTKYQKPQKITTLKQLFYFLKKGKLFFFF